MICPKCGYNMVPDNSDYGYGCVVCAPPEEEEEGMTEQEQAWDELVSDAESGAVLIPERRAAILAKDAELKDLRGRTSDLDAMVLWAVAEFRVGRMPLKAQKLLNWRNLRENIEKDALKEALSCSAQNCSEFGHIHDGDCSACPQGTIRARAGLAAKEER